ncbi:MAG: hypothetical protein JWQ23_397 [Herminiimonas sp.]|nr:hypothetical protein [Herminiimonas sp.]
MERRQQRKQYFGCRAHQAPGRHMPSQHTALRIGHGHVKMRAIGRQRPGKAQDLQVPAQFGGALCAGKPQLRHAQAADALKYEASIHLMLG